MPAPFPGPASVTDQLEHAWKAEQHRMHCPECGSLRRPESASTDEARPESEPTPFSAPDLGGRSRLGRYLLIGEVASGGMGVVFEAWDPDLRRKVAVKVLLYGHDDPRTVERFHREAHAAARLTHPNIIAVHEMGLDKAVPNLPVYYLVMDLIRGPDMGERLGLDDESDEEAAPVEPMPLHDQVALLEQVGRAVGFAHSQGVIHRDIKPGNILMDSDDRAIVTDFGLARLHDSRHARMTESGAAMGTYHYMAPEQLLGEQDKVDARCDVWALGVILYEMLTGELPFDGSSSSELFRAILERAPTPPRQIKADVPADLETICLVAVDRERSNRYPNGEALAEDLCRWRAGAPILGRRPSRLRRLLPTLRRHPWRALTAVLLVSMLIGGLTWHKLRMQAFEAHKIEAERAAESEQWAAAQVAAERALSIEATPELAQLLERSLAEVTRRREAREASARRADAMKRLHPYAQNVESVRPYMYIPRVGPTDPREKLDGLIRALAPLERDEELGEYPELWQLVGEAAWLGGDLGAAQNAWTTAVARDPDDPWSRFLLGRLELHRHWLGELLDDPTAGQWLERAKENLIRARRSSFSDEQRSHLVRTYVAYIEGDVEKTRRMCELGQRSFEDRLGREEFWHLLGWVQTGPDRVDAWSNALAIRPHHPCLLTFRALHRARVGLPELALKDLRHAQGLNPTSRWISEAMKQVVGDD